MKKEVTLAQALSLPIAISENILDKNLPIDETLKTVEKEGLLNEFKGPYCSGVKASYIFNDTITVQHFNEGKQPDGTYLITYVYKYIDKYKMSVYVRVLTSGIKRTLKYHRYPSGTKLKIKGDLDMYVCGPLCFDGDSHSVPDKMANVAVTITIIDIL